MARGYPDRFGQPQFPKYGGARSIDIDVTVPASTLQVIAAVNGKGLIYWGFVQAACSSNHKLDEVLLYVDNVLIQQRHFWSLSHKNLINYRRASLYLVQYDVADYYYSVVLSNGITFDTGVKLKYNNKGSDNVIIDGGLVYAIITR